VVCFRYITVHTLHEGDNKDDDDDDDDNNNNNNNNNVCWTRNYAKESKFLGNSLFIGKSMEQIPPTEVNCGSVHEEITLTVWNRKVCYRRQFPPDVKVVSFIHNLKTRHAGPIRDTTFLHKSVK